MLYYSYLLNLVGQALACKFSRTDLSPAEFSYKRVSDYTRSSKGSNQYNHTHFDT